MALQNQGTVDLDEDSFRNDVIKLLQERLNEIEQENEAKEKEQTEIKKQLNRYEEDLRKRRQINNPNKSGEAKQTKLIT